VLEGWHKGAMREWGHCKEKRYGLEAKLSKLWKCGGFLQNFTDCYKNKIPPRNGGGKMALAILRDLPSAKD